MKPVFIPDAAANTLVIGDVILDRYVHGETTRISPEAPVPVVRVTRTEERPGGAANVALNISCLGVRVSLAGLTGQDSAADTLTRTLSEYGVDCSFQKSAGFPTITKLRVLSQHQQLIRLDYEAATGPVDCPGLFEQIKAQLGHADVIVLSDYAKGSLANIQAFISACRSANKKVLVDPKGDDFTRYRGATLLTPNLKEFEAVAGCCGDTDELVNKGEKLCRDLGLEALLVTRGEHGMSLISMENGPHHLAAEALEVFDVTGAGDTVIATMAAALASGYDYLQAARFANRAAGLVVGKLGTATVTVEELNDTSRQHDSDQSPLLQPSELPALLREIRSRGETIVMTNGCFDILHAGHVQYLQQARQLGDHLIVAVNDDDSVKRLKGPGRPLNPLAHRMAVLAALKSVDWVMAFSEDTPEELIAKILPDVLVKGGDYRPEQIAGARQVLEHGGSVKIIPLLENCSTSRIIDSVKTTEGHKR